MTKSKIIQIALPSTGEEEWQATKEPIMSGWLTQGPKVAEFEKAFSKRHCVSNAIATTSCTTALHLALAAMGIGPGDEVIVPAFTWIATANVVLYCGAKPVLADVDKNTFNINIDDAVSKITKNTKAVIAVHLFGLCVDVEELRSKLPENIYILEDAACAAGASINSFSAGGLGDAAAFSFHPRKSITTGEGGMLTTVHDELAFKASQLRNHGASISEEQRHHGPRPHIMPDFNVLGFNYRMTDVQGAIGLAQLKKLNLFVEERAKWAVWYKDNLSNIDWLTTPSEPEQGNHAWQSYVLYIKPDLAPKTRNEIMDVLLEKGISTRPGTHAIHLLSYYSERFGFKADDFPSALDCDRNSMAIPLHNKMEEDDYQYVSEMLHAIK